MEKEQFKQVRQARGLTQQAAADFLGVSKSTVCKWETGVNPVPAWVDEKLQPRSGPIFRLDDMTPAEIASCERLAAQKGLTADGLASLLIRQFMAAAPIILALLFPAEVKAVFNTLLAWIS